MPSYQTQNVSVELASNGGVQVRSVTGVPVMKYPDVVGLLVERPKWLEPALEAQLVAQDSNALQVRDSFVGERPAGMAVQNYRSLQRNFARHEVLNDESVPVHLFAAPLTRARMNTTEATLYVLPAAMSASENAPQFARVVTSPTGLPIYERSYTTFIEALADLPQHQQMQAVRTFSALQARHASSLGFTPAQTIEVPLDQAQSAGNSRAAAAERATTATRTRYDTYDQSRAQTDTRVDSAVWSATETRTDSPMYSATQTRTDSAAWLSTRTRTDSAEWPKTEPQTQPVGFSRWVAHRYTGNDKERLDVEFDGKYLGSKRLTQEGPVLHEFALTPRPENGMATIARIIGDQIEPNSREIPGTRTTLALTTDHPLIEELPPGETFLLPIETQVLNQIDAIAAHDRRRPVDRTADLTRTLSR